jgi:hypothetical protein
MSRHYTSKDSLTNWDRINAMQDEEIDLTDIPELTAEQFAKATLRVAGKRVPKGKVIVPLFLDEEVIAHYRKIAGKTDYLILINEVLKSHIQEEDLEGLLRRVIREELASTREE